MICKLNILEPWEFGTEKGIEIKDFDKFNNHILLHIKNPYIIDNEPYNFLLAKMRGDEKINLLSSISFKKNIMLTIVYDKNIDDMNFINYNIKEFRNNFLLGELIIE